MLPFSQNFVLFLIDTSVAWGIFLLVLMAILVLLLSIAARQYLGSGGPS